MRTTINVTNLTIAQLLRHYREGDFTPRTLIRHLLNCAERLENYNNWIYRCGMQDLEQYLSRLEQHSVDELPLYGIPFAIKDNINLASVPTTAACPNNSYVPQRSAYAVQLLLDAGAIPLGKTNMDQFSTGLTGTRSPYGATHNAFYTNYISGGSSAGSAVSVAQGLVSFALGTDTAGSGRVPAAFNNIFALKPSKGLVSTHGVIPACRSLDCVSIFATSAADLERVATVVYQYDPQTPYSRPAGKPMHKHTMPVPEHFSFAVPQPDQLQFFGNTDYPALFADTIRVLEALGGIKQTIDFSPFIEAGRLFYSGPWISERYATTQTLLESSPESFLGITLSVILEGKTKTAVEAFQSQYSVQKLKKVADTLLAPFDFLLTPTVGTHYSIDQMKQDPVGLDQDLGYYTSYVNLFDYCAVAVPAGFSDVGLPFGVTLSAEAFADQRLIYFANVLQRKLNLKLGATHWPAPLQDIPQSPETDYINLVVCGAHMSGLTLNHELMQCDARIVERCKTVPRYRLYAVNTDPPQAGLVRQAKRGVAVEVEVWQLPHRQLGSFLADIPHPLGLGKVELYDGRWETGIICEAYVKPMCEDISRLGSWRLYLQPDVVL